MFASETQPMEFPHSQRSKLSLLGLSKGFWPAQHVWDNIGKGKKPLEFAGGREGSKQEQNYFNG